MPVSAFRLMVRYRLEIVKFLVRNSTTDLQLGALGDGSGDGMGAQEVPAGPERRDGSQAAGARPGGPAIRTGASEPRVNLTGFSDALARFGTDRSRLVCVVASQGRLGLLTELAALGFDIGAEHAGEATVDECLPLARGGGIPVDERLRTVRTNVDARDELLRYRE
jgi:hypothetical protein